MKHLNLPYKVAFMTLGCKVNQYESERLMSKFLSAGFEIVQFNEYADVYIVNTCTVTNIADRKSRKMLHRASRMNEEALVVAMGCFAQAEGESLLLDQRIKLIIGNDKKEQAFEIITKHLNLTTNISEQEDNPKMIINERTRAYIKIQDGCNQFCSYCKIPYVRGKLRSKAQDEIVEEVELLASNGYKEVVLTGIHLSSYGVDKTKCATFVELRGEPLLGLLGRIEQVEGIERIRLGSLEPRIITDEFISGLVNIKKVCPHFHLSLQSGSDSVLERMNRKYRTKDYKNACDIIRTYYTSPAITTDIIVGFPGETIEEFNETVNFVRDIQFSSAHIFKYSRRDGTRAATMMNQVAEEIKNQRSQSLILQCENLENMYVRQFLGEEQQCLIEEICTINNQQFWVGHNVHYIKCIIPYNAQDKHEENTFYTGTVEKVLENNILLMKPKIPC